MLSKSYASLLASGKISINDLLIFLKKVHQTPMLPAIISSLKDLERADQNDKKVIIASPFPLSAEALDLLLLKINATKDTRVELKIDPSLLAGAVIRRGNILLDLSARKIINRFLAS